MSEHFLENVESVRRLIILGYRPISLPGDDGVGFIILSFIQLGDQWNGELVLQLVLSGLITGFLYNINHCTKNLSQILFLSFVRYLTIKIDWIKR